MKKHTPSHEILCQLLATVLLGTGLPARCADPLSLREAFREHFPMGTAVNRNIVTGTASPRRSTDLVQKDIELVQAQFNQITAENDMKWQLIHPREGTEGYDFAPADAFVAFGQRHGMQVVGHTLVWHSQTPTWVFAGTNPPPPAAETSPSAAGAAGRPPFGAGGGGFGRYNGPRASREELLLRMRDHIRTVVGRYKGRVQVWDVVNEALADGNGTNILRSSLWLEIIGPDFIAKAFHYAHEADPQAILRYNDYGLENPAKRRRLHSLIRSLLKEGVPVHAIGSQAHVNVSTTFESMDEALSDMATLGLPIHITELDVNSARTGQRGTGAEVGANASTTQGALVEEVDQRLATAYAGIFRAFLKHRDSVKLVTFWGVNDAVSWRSNGKPLLFDGENRPKPAFSAVLEETKRPAGR